MATSVIGNLRVNLGLDTAAFQSGLRQVNKSLARMADTMKSVGQSMSVGLTAPLTGFSALSVRAAGDFEASMNRVQAATGATQAEFDAMRQAARDMGKETQFSAIESADAIEVLAKNGLDTSQILGGALKASMLLAASAGTDIANAGDIATDVMLQFGKQAKDLIPVVDGINGTLLESKFNIDDYRLALAQAGGVAGGLGVSFDDFNAAIAGTSALFASGSDAGTSFKTFLTRLVPASGPAADAMKKLGLEFFRADGSMKSMAEVSQELKEGLAGLSDEARNEALSTIFGTDALRTAIGLAEQGADGIDRLKASIGDVSAEEQAAARMKGWNGELKKLGNAIKELQIAIGDSGLLEWASNAVRWLSQLVAKLSESNPELLKWGVIIGGVAAALGPLLLGLGALAAGVPVVVAGLSAIVAAFAALSAPVSAALAVLAGAATLITANWDTVGPFFTALVTSIKDLFVGLAKTLAGIVNGDMPLMVSGIKQAWTGLDTFFQTLWDGIVGVFTAAWDKIKPIVNSLATAVDAMKGVRDGPISIGPDPSGSTGPILPGTDTYYDERGNLTNGLRAGTSGIGKQGTVDAKDYAQDFRDGMGIKSPSRVMMEIGGYLSEGLSAGIEGGKGLVDAASDRVGGSMSGRFLSYFDGVTRGAKSLSDVFANVQNAFANMLSDMSSRLISSGLSSILGSIFAAADPLTSAMRGAGLPAIAPTMQMMSPMIGNMVSGSAITAAAHVTVGVDQKTGNLTAFVDERAGAASAKALGAYDRAMPLRVQQITARPRAR